MTKLYRGIFFLLQQPQFPSLLPISNTFRLLSIIKSSKLLDTERKLKVTSFNVLPGSKHKNTVKLRHGT